jgi:hypothetical protein
MICHLEADSRLTFHLDNSHPRLNTEDLALAQSYWEKIVQKNPSVFDGEIYSCNSLVQDATGIHIHVDRTNYSLYKWARDHKKTIPGTHVMGTCMFVFDKQRESYVLVQRADTVAFDVGKISGIGGVVDYQEVGMASFSDYIQQAVETEVSEELITTNGVHGVSLLGLYYDSETLKTEFAYYGEAQVLGVKANENKRIVEVGKNQLGAYVHDFEDQIEESTKNHLLHRTSALLDLMK